MSDDSTRRQFVLAGVFAVVVLGTAAVGPMVVDARPAFEIPVESGADEGDFGNATTEAWTEVPASTVSLGASGSSVPAAGNVTVDQMKVRAVQTDERLYVRLSWDDATVDRSTASTRSFADAVAVQLPANSSARPPIAMGGSGNRVNVWYWSADNRTEELVAGGPGSTTPFEERTVASDATNRNERWHLVFERSLDATSANRTAIPTDGEMDISVAVWNGSNMERSGQKAVSEWHYLALGSDSGGPPYQTILWVIAGLAIVGSALVSIEGIRRTRGE